MSSAEPPPLPPRAASFDRFSAPKRHSLGRTASADRKALGDASGGSTIITAGIDTTTLTGSATDGLPRLRVHDDGAWAADDDAPGGGSSFWAHAAACVRRLAAASSQPGFFDLPEAAARRKRSGATRVLHPCCYALL